MTVKKLGLMALMEEYGSKCMQSPLFIKDPCPLITDVAFDITIIDISNVINDLLEIIVILA